MGTEINKRELDRYITGNYGEDSVGPDESLDLDWIDKALGLVAKGDNRGAVDLILEEGEWSNAIYHLARDKQALIGVLYSLYAELRGQDV